MNENKAKIEMPGDRCRVCLEYMENTILLYTTTCINDEILSYLEILHIISNFKIGSNENAPQNICTTCAERAELSYEFKLLCERSEKMLQSELSSYPSYTTNKGSDNIKIEFNGHDIGYSLPFKIESMQDMYTRNSFEPSCENTIQFNFDNSMDFDCISTDRLNGSPCQFNILRNGNSFISNIRSDLLQTNYSIDSNSQKLNTDTTENSFYPLEHDSTKESSSRNNCFIYCEKCGGQFVRKINLIKHIQRCEKMFPKLCPHCDYEPKSYKNYIEHMNIHNNICKHCNLKIINPAAYLKHLQIYHSDKIIECKLCKKKFFETKLYAQHVRKQHPEERKYPNNCLVCNFEPTSHLSFINHMKEAHGGVHLKKCKYCDYSNICNKILKRHRRLKHADKKTAHCTKCDKKYFTKKDLLDHMKKMHTKGTPVKCKICLKSFSSKSHLEQHMRVHNGQKIFECKLCNIQLNDQSLLEAHEKTHKEQKNFICPECGSNFKKLKGLNDHLLRVHKLQKKFKCTVCTKKFFHDTQLKEHIVVHTEIKSFDCDTCGKTFKSKYNLQVHLVVHSGEKPHHCKYCGKKFTQITGLKKHLTHHHNKS